MKRSDNLTGALLMMGSIAGFTINDTFLKLLAGNVPMFQVLFLRGALTTGAVAVIAWRMGAFGGSVPRRDWGIMAIRTLAEVSATYCFLTALFHMPLANITAIMQALPLSLALVAALVFREPLGWRRLTAIAVGFCGVMLIVRPGSEGFNTYALYGLAAVGCVTVRDLSTRRLSRGVPSMLVTFVTSASVMTVFGMAGLGREWVPMTGSEIGLITGAAAFAIGGYVSSIMAMRIGEITYTAQFRYTSLLWALLLGWFIFGDWPTSLTLLGAGIVVASGVFTLYREAKLGLRKSGRSLLPRR
ncbi:DMT family transporter [Pseudohalocynthiibacter aestuariivivens]|uniref:DMT family transporter n=1 Tax=Roseovarius pelagicus TaxID=2980108 RepID=A0ABY6DGS8_9RHOB|nr:MULTISPECIES: DMT family transporter [Rhodobacterales]QIE47012.1 DMT family transporter [Pseudohalocynthiibacter aestuariivivens]UXX84438.1 DMT family transporter [Roseovarius pelagicus]